MPYVKFSLLQIQTFTAPGDKQAGLKKKKKKYAFRSQIRVTNEFTAIVSEKLQE